MKRVRFMWVTATRALAFSGAPRRRSAKLELDPFVTDETLIRPVCDDGPRRATHSSGSGGPRHRDHEARVRRTVRKLKAFLTACPLRYTLPPV